MWKSIFLFTRNYSERIEKSFLSCFDYANRLADVVVGHMAAPMDQSMTDSMQSITMRNKLGEDMIENAMQWGALKLYGNADERGS